MKSQHKKSEPITFQDLTVTISYIINVYENQLDTIRRFIKKRRRHWNWARNHTWCSEVYIREREKELDELEALVNLAED